MAMENFCCQCEQTANGTGCTKVGVCGKDPKTSVLQDLVVFAVKGVAMYAHRAAQLGSHDDTLGRTIVESLFGTVTNVNFDPTRVEVWLRLLGRTLERARALHLAACERANRRPELLGGPAAFAPAATLEGLVEQASVGSVKARIRRVGADVGGLQDLVLFGLKGAAAYAEHAAVPGKEDPAIYAGFYALLDQLARETGSVEEYFGAALKVGALNLEVMALLAAANTGAYGNPVPTQVRVTARKGEAILISGHDLKDLEALLEQAEGKAIDVYTHGEMLPAHGYPALKKHRHLAGNWGGAWQDQVREFDAFPGAFLFTTHCIQRPRESYRGRVFTSGLVAFPGVRHLTDRNFAPVIDAALAQPGFAADEPEKKITVGFGHEAVLGIADKIVDAVKKGAIRRLFVIGGCDGAKSGRDYYTRFAEAAPKDTVILTLACGKYRFNKLELGEIGGLPRLLDLGQCNDAYSAVVVVSVLAEALGTGVNALPLSFILSWYEQKAVAVLLTLLHLGIKNIRLGPSLPGFLTPAALNVLVEKYGIKPIGAADTDLEACLSP